MALPTFKAPLTFKIYSDGSILEFVAKSKDMYIYKYIKEEGLPDKIGKQLPITEDNLIKLLNTQELWKKP